jgi:hypothetical protein
MLKFLTIKRINKMNNKSYISGNAVYLLILVFFAFGQSYAQVSASANFIKGGKEDAVKIISAYLLPVERALSFDGANNNILLFKSNKTSDLNYGIGINLTTSFVNSEDYAFDVNKLNLTEFEAKDPNKTIAQTIAGNESTIVLQTKDKYRVPSSSYPYYTEKPILTLNSPKGNDNTIIPFAIFNMFVEKQGNFIDVKILPPTKIPSKSLGLFNVGINLQHNLETSLKSMSDFWFDLYVSGGYNYNKVTYYIDIKPNENSLIFSPSSDNGPYDNQELLIHSVSIPLRLNAVKQLNNFSFSLGSGYNITNSKVEMIGKYPVYKADPSNTFQVIAEDIEDPFQYTRDFNKMLFDFGVNYRLKHFSAGLKYTNSYYNNIDLSLGFLF